MFHADSSPELAAISPITRMRELTCCIVLPLLPLPNSTLDVLTSACCKRCFQAAHTLSTSREIVSLAASSRQIQIATPSLLVKERKGSASSPTHDDQSDQRSAMMTSPQPDQICGDCSQSQRHRTTYSPGGTAGTRTLSTIAM